MRQRRKYTPKEVFRIKVSQCMRMSPQELCAELERNERLPKAPLDYELDRDDDTLAEDECPDFDDMDGDE